MQVGGGVMHARELFPGLLDLKRRSPNRGPGSSSSVSSVGHQGGPKSGEHAQRFAAQSGAGRLAANACLRLRRGTSGSADDLGNEVHGGGPFLAGSTSLTAMWVEVIPALRQFRFTLAEP